MICGRSVQNIRCKEGEKQMEDIRYAQANMNYKANIVPMKFSSNYNKILYLGENFSWNSFFSI